MQNQIIILVIFAIIICTVFGQDSSTICKCGSFSYSCCADNDFCSVGLINHCPKIHRVDSSLCTADVKKCSKCRCGKSWTSYTCCKDKSFCSNGSTQHCSQTNRVNGCDFTTSACYKNSFLEEEFAKYYVPEEEENA